MPSRTIEEDLRDQFYDWELWGRGWQTWDAPVHLEPPFRPFPGHFVKFRRLPDDGHRPTALSRMAALVKGEKSVALVPNEGEPIEDEREPDYIGTVLDLRSFALYVPGKRVVRPDAMAALHAGLRAVKFPIAFEIAGTSKGIAVGLSMRAADEGLVLSALRAHFPDVTPVARDPLAEWVSANWSAPFGVFEVGLRREFMLPLGTARSFDPDPLLPFVAALDDLAEGELGAFQVLFEPAHSPWAESVLRAVTTEEGGDFFSDAPQLQRLAREKVMQPLFAAAVRLAVGGYDEERLQARLVRLATGLDSYGRAGGNEFFYLSDEVTFDRQMDFVGRQSHRSGMLLGLSELVALVHMPSASVEIPKLLRSLPGTKAAPAALKGHALVLGVNAHAGEETVVSLPPELRMRHMHVVGASGTGKSTFLLDLLTQTVESGAGLALLDPHGDLVDELLLRIPENRIEDVIILDPSDTEFPVGFNLLAAHSDLEATLLASDLVAVFRRLSTSWGDQMHSVLANAIQAFLSSKTGGTLADLRRFLIEPDFREEFLGTVEDEETVYYWRKEFPILVGKPQGPILTRLDTFLRPKPLRHIFMQRQNRLDFREILDGGRIFLAKLAQGAIGEENAALLGSLLVAKFHQAAMSRQELAREARRDFHLVIDEFQEMVTPSLATILAGTRKFRLGLTAAHQDLRSLYEADATVANALLANAGTRVVFRVSDEDANRLADGFTSFPASALRALGVGEAVCRVDRADWDFNLRTRVPAAPDANAVERRERIIARSRAKYAGRIERPPAKAEPKPEDNAPSRRGGLDELLGRLERSPKKPAKDE
jgi:hypothetical protein